jgi:hypothetical protein
LRKGAGIIEEAPDIVMVPHHGSAPAEQPKTEVSVGRARTTDSAPKPALWLSTGIGKIISSYEAVDEVLADIAGELGIKQTFGLMVMKELRQRDLVIPDVAELYTALRKGRNAVAHARALPNEAEVTEYVRQSAYL